MKRYGREISPNSSASRHGTMNSEVTMGTMERFGHVGSKVFAPRTLFFLFWPLSNDSQHV